MKNNKLKKKRKITIEEKKIIIENFVYKNIKYINNPVLIEEFESDYSDDEEIIDIEEIQEMEELE